MNTNIKVNFKPIPQNLPAIKATVSQEEKKETVRGNSPESTPESTEITMSVTDYIERMKETQNGVKGDDYETLAQEYEKQLKDANIHADSVGLPDKLRSLIDLAERLLDLAPTDDLKEYWQSQIDILEDILKQVEPDGGPRKGAPEGEEIKAGKASEPKDGGEQIIQEYLQKSKDFYGNAKIYLASGGPNGHYTFNILEHIRSLGSELESLIKENDTVRAYLKKTHGGPEAAVDAVLDMLYEVNTVAAGN